MTTLFKRWVKIRYKVFDVLIFETQPGIESFQGEAYYKSLGYNTLMEGVIGEAEVRILLL